MRDLMSEIRDKWVDVQETSSDWGEKTLVGEFLNDLHMLEDTQSE